MSEPGVPDEAAPNCTNCGQPLRPGAGFCRACGAKVEEPTPEPAVVDPEPPTRKMSGGLTCRGCGAALVPGTAFCRSCGTPVEAATVPRPAPTPPSRRRGWALFAAAAILVLGAGAAAAIVLGSSTSSVTTNTQVSANPTESTPPPAAEGTEEGLEETPTQAEGLTASGVPTVDRSQMSEEIRSLLLSYHEDVVDRDFRAAWALLSARKRQQDLREYGYATWVRAQASLSSYLSPAGLRSSIDALEGEGVARVEVTGMGWSAPGASCSQWSGLTWVRYEHGTWTYDPGYSTTPERSRNWKHRFHELLGGDC